MLHKRKPRHYDPDTQRWAVAQCRKALELTGHLLPMTQIGSALGIPGYTLQRWLNSPDLLEENPENSESLMSLTLVPTLEKLVAHNRQYQPVMSTVGTDPKSVQIKMLQEDNKRLREVLVYVRQELKEVIHGME